MDHLSATESLNRMEMSPEIHSRLQHVNLCELVPRPLHDKFIQDLGSGLCRVNESASLVIIISTFTLQRVMPEPSTTS
jgi:hypothetical protein